MKMLITIVVAFFLSACAAQTPVTSLPSMVAGKTVGDDLIAAARNLDQAIAVNKLPANDPMDLCLHGILKQAGIEKLPGAPDVQPFTPENAGLVSAGSIAYILAQEARAAGGFQVPADCQSLIGKLVIDGAHDVSLGLRLLR